ncbi:MAG: chromosome segregation protein SMC [Cyclobacteriaceae bacterium]
MQLTKLELKGFKSFADRVVINFDEGITGIVGPNGCGKSNVVDSIRWVLGEQKTRVLRSDKMESVIFNGTKNRKPTQMAEVSLTFNNTKNLLPTEYSQVTITRRYYRSGDSEYMLNGVTCRLKDITNLFLDTGIASNSYAIIELKMVDDLLNDKDNSRRALFEEAAGISKFKIRKKETLKKLDDTDADLDRVEDLLFEIDKNLKSLERQATQAKKYYEVKDDYKNSSIAFAKKAMMNQQETHDGIQKEIQEENDKKLALNTLANEKESAIEKAKSELISKEKLLSSRQKSLNEHVSKIRQYESDKKIKNERQNFLQDKIENLKEQISTDQVSTERTSVSLDGLQRELSEAEVEFQSISQNIEGLKADYEKQKELTTEAQQKLDQLNQYFSDKREHNFQISKEIEIKDIQLKSMMGELSKTSEDSTSQSANIEEFQKRLAEIEKERNAKNQDFEKLKKSEEELVAKIQQHEEKIAEAKDGLSMINRNLDARQNEFGLTKSLVDNLEGFPEAIKFLKKQNQFKDAPLLSDIISCPEEYRVAIENYLEPYMNYYVVSSYKEALDAVEILSDSSIGKANFFILDQLKSYDGSTQKIDRAESAMSLLEFDAKYEKLIQFLLSNVFIYEEEIPLSNDNVVYLDKSGKLTRRQFSVSGGSVGLFEGKRIGRAKNLEKLEVEIKQLQKDQEKSNKEVDKLSAELANLKISSESEQLEQLQEELARINETYVSIQTKQDQFSELLSTNKNRREDIQQQVIDLEEALTKLKPDADREKLELGEMEIKVSTLREEATSLQDLLDSKSAIFNEQNVVFHQRQNTINSFQQEISYKREAFENTKLRIERNREDLEATAQNLNELVKKSTENDDELVGMYEEKESLEAGVNEAEKLYYEGRALIDEEEKNLRETQRQREGIDHALMEWQNKLNEAKMGLNSVKDRLSVEFSIDLEKVSEEQIEPYKKYSEEDLQNKVEKLRNRIENMGPINPMAMEAFDEIQERHTFISEQKEDLLKAKESLLATISEIDEVAKETFMEAFDKIKHNFINVFRTLFTEEDDCDLTLSDPENPLESAIEIIAKPKGKRPLTINQLSGGEKTLTATSLLFSIYLLKPAPFCIFDEVDAPLDDANIDKFNDIIRKFSKDSQFIIVTHNKRSMSSTDVIYGVTMQEQGVSKVIPVDLRELV